MFWIILKTLQYYIAPIEHLTLRLQAYVVPNISKTTTGGKPFKLSHQLLLWIQETETTSNFKVKL